MGWAWALIVFRRGIIYTGTAFLPPQIFNYLRKDFLKQDRRFLLISISQFRGYSQAPTVFKVRTVTLFSYEKEESARFFGQFAWWFAYFICLDLFIHSFCVFWLILDYLVFVCDSGFSSHGLLLSSTVFVFVLMFLWFLDK